ncbi:MAG: cyclic nucleotide-binding domain-containing protein [Elusimicrobia bacterium]|nr:cyclic nucleotide-binding domain-containing protein [Candidatus Obscuribacterium magneticum]
MQLSREDVRWLFEKLRKIDFLAYHSDEELAQLAQSINKVLLPAGKTIIRQAQQEGSYYLIRSGSVMVWGETPQGRQRLAALEAGDSFGEVSILTGEVCNATVTAETPVELFLLSPESLRQVVRANPVLAEKMAEAIARRKGVRALGLEPSADTFSHLLARVRAFFGIEK